MLARSASGARATPAGGSSTLSSADPFGDGREVVIRHGGLEDRLRITRAGTLILTK